MIRSLSILLPATRRRPRSCERIRIAGLESLVAFPSSGEGPAIVCVNAATPHGIEQPIVRQFVERLAGAGFVAIAPELPGVRERRVTPETVDSLVRVSQAAGQSVALIGASTGAGLAILAAADPLLAERVTAVAAIAPFASLRNMLRLATTGHYLDGPFDASPVLGETATRSLAASAPHDPLVPVVVANRCPDRFDELFEQLGPRTRDVVERLSPARRIADVLAPIELAACPDDRFVPVAEAYALADAHPSARLTVTSALDHVRPRPHPGVVRVAGLLERTLRRAVEGGSHSWLRRGARPVLSHSR